MPCAISSPCGHSIIARRPGARPLRTRSAIASSTGAWTSDPQRDRELNWRLDPARSIGLAGELGTHQFDVIHWYTGRYPTSVRGSGSVRLYDDGRTMPDTIWCDLAFADGVHLQYQATLANSFEGRYE
ncbi:MAG: Gfo/Idh/MocA family protein, partial [Planctomycetota bacterium]